MHRAYLIVTSIVLLLGVGCQRDSSFSVASQIITLGDSQFVVYRADTPNERSIGLSNVDSLGTNQGMIFIWPQAQAQAFWMKGVDYPLDLVWLRDQTVVGTVTMLPEAATTPQQDYQYYYSPGPVNQVVELPAGTIENIGLTLGDKLYMD